MSRYFNLRVPAETGDRMKPHALAIGWSPNGFAERCIAAICDMIEDPSKRILPEMVAMIDAIRVSRRQPLSATKPLAPAKPARKNTSLRPAAAARSR